MVVVGAIVVGTISLDGRIIELLGPVGRGGRRRRGVGIGLGVGIATPTVATTDVSIDGAIDRTLAGPVCRATDITIGVAPDRAIDRTLAGPVCRATDITIGVAPDSPSISLADGSVQMCVEPAWGRSDPCLGHIGGDGGQLVGCGGACDRVHEVRPVAVKTALVYFSACDPGSTAPAAAMAPGPTL